jgi:hypothetical protein
MQKFLISCILTLMRKLWLIVFALLLMAPLGFAATRKHVHHKRPYVYARKARHLHRVKRLSPGQQKKLQRTGQLPPGQAKKLAR